MHARLAFLVLRSLCRLRRRARRTARFASSLPILLAACSPPLPPDTAADPDTAIGADTDAGDAGDTASAQDTADTGDPQVPAFELTAGTEYAGRAVALRTNLPARTADCEALEPEGADCADLDGDGLVDAWEALALEHLRPTVRFDEDEPMLDDAGAVLADVGRVAPASDGRVRVFLMIGYSDDYGRCGLTAHAGDSERVAMDLALGEDPTAGDAEVVGLYTAAHEGELNDHGLVLTGDDLSQAEFVEAPETGAPRWRVYSSEGKHATYANTSLCEGAEFLPCLEEDCAPDGVGDAADYDRLPPFLNAGEPDAPLANDLASIGFPGDDAWLDQPFCGGHGQKEGCSSSVRSKLLDDPFVE